MTAVSGCYVTDSTPDSMADLERLTKPFDVPPTDQRACKRKERLVDVCPPLMSDAQSAEAM
jgi:hypothetical protein